jgi:hypothetical protein
VVLISAPTVRSTHTINPPRGALRALAAVILGAALTQCAPPPPSTPDASARDAAPACTMAEDPGPATQCGAANITLSGNCRCVVGYYWTGSRCTPTNDACECILGCERLYPTEAACNAGHARCPR